MKKLLVATCLLVGAQCTLCLDENKTPSNNNDPRRKAELFFLEYCNAIIKTKLIQTAVEELELAQQDSNYKINERSRKILEAYGLLNNDGIVEDDVYYAINNLEKEFDKDPESFFERLNFEVPDNLND